MKRSILHKFLLAIIVFTSVCCYYHLNYCVEYNVSNDAFVANIGYVNDLVDKDDKLKDFLMVIIKSFVQTAF